MYHCKTYMYINFKQNRVSCRSVKTCTQSYLQNCKLHKFATCNYNFEQSRLSDMHSLLTDIQADFQINRLIRYQIRAKRKYFHRRQSDGKLGGRTEKRTDRDNNR